MTGQALHILWSDDGQHIRKWDRRPFEGSTPFVRSPDLSATSAGEREALRMAVHKLLPIGDPKAPDDRVLPIYVRMSELRALHALAQPSAPQAQVSGVPSAEEYLRQQIPNDAPFWADAEDPQFERSLVIGWLEEYAMLAASPSPAQQDGEVEVEQAARRMAFIEGITGEEWHEPQNEDACNAYRRLARAALNPSSEERRG